MNKTPLILALSAAAIMFSAPADAVLQQGAVAPALTATGALAGERFTFNLQDELKKGPVVLYFFPKAFTPGCNMEANAFAEHIDDFKNAGAEVFGLSGDNFDQLKEFSVKECAGKFPVATATPATIRAFDVAFAMNGQTNAAMTGRTSYVIGRNGRVVMVHSDLNFNEHVEKTLAAVRALHNS
ncbi:MAG: peroxiredoxin [Croceibacterium sp.]